VKRAVGTENTLGTESGTDPASFSTAELSEILAQKGAKSAKSPLGTLLALLAPHHTENSDNYALRQGCRTTGNPTREGAWLGALKSLEEDTSEVKKRRTNTVCSPVDEISESLVHRGAKSAKSSTPSPDGEAPSDVNPIDAKPKVARRTLVTSQDQLARVVADLKDIDLIALDLETTGLDPRKDSIRLLSLAIKDTTYIVDCWNVDPAELFPILTEKTLVAHNALFDLGFLSSLGFVPGKVADTMILSQLLHAGAKVEPLRRGQTSHSLDSVVKRELGLELDKTQQRGDWGGTLTPEMIEYAARDVEVLLPLHEVLKAKIEEAGLTYVAEIEHRTLRNK
jgi:hypothetical protein